MKTLKSLDLHTLQAMYESKVRELMEHLEKGRPWEETKDLRDSLSELSAIIYDKINASNCEP